MAGEEAKGAGGRGGIKEALCALPGGRRKAARAPGARSAMRLPGLYGAAVRASVCRFNNIPAGA